MADRFFDVTASGGLNTGVSTDDAFTSLVSMKSGMSAGDRLWVRRTMLEVVSTDFDLTNNGTRVNPIELIGWPRASKATTGDFTSGSRTVDNVASNDLVKFQHGCRNIVCPDGENYWIESITDTNTFQLNKEYAGTTVTSGSFTIQQDIMYDEAQDIDDSAWTTKLTTWNADPDTVPGIDFNGNSADFNSGSDNFWNVYNFQWVNADKTILFLGGYGWSLYNCYVEPGYNRIPLNLAGREIKFINCHIVGIGGNTNYNQFGIQSIFNRCYIDNMAWAGLNGGEFHVSDCNIGTVSGLLNTGAFYVDGREGHSTCKNCLFGAGIIPPYVVSSTQLVTSISVEHFNRDVKDNRKYISQVGSAISNDGSGADVDLRTSGADNIVDILFSKSATVIGRRSDDDSTSDFASAPLIFEHRIWQTSLTSKTYRYYVQSVTDALTSEEMWLEVEDVYENIYKSSNSITARSGAGDWTNYIEASCAQATPGWVTLRVFCAKYSAVSHRYIDPAVEIS